MEKSKDIVAVVGEYLHLTPVGKLFKACCPFHREKTPSFMVNPQNQTFYCFGCHAGGDVFRFVELYEGVGRVKSGPAETLRPGKEMSV
jgi:DNA primase